MAGYVPERSAPEVGESQWPELKVFVVAVGDVEPLRRRGTHGVFNDSAESGTAHDRVVRILRGFREGHRIPPIEVARKDTGFKLVHGAHRFYCAVAAGYTHIAAVEVVDVWGGSAV